jgi:hypothetical protein
VSDELAERVRALEAERARPDRPGQTTQELLARLVATLAKVFTTPPDDDPLRSVEGRVAAYGRLREHGLSRATAAMHVGVSKETARRYENRLASRREDA